MSITKISPPELLDLHDDGELQNMYDIMTAADGAARPHLTPPPFSMTQDFYRRPREHQEVRAFKVMNADRMVGVATITLPLTSNTDSSRLNVFVHPDFQRQGVATSLAAHCEKVSAQEGRLRVLALGLSVPGQNPEVRSRRIAWSQMLGYRLAQEYVTYSLDLSAHGNKLAEHILAANSRCADYDIAVYHQEIPTELVPSYTELYCAMNDEEPGGCVGDAKQVITPESVIEELAARAERGEDNWYALATRSGQVVAHSDVRLFSTSTTAEQLNTLVLPEHRGYRLGTALKCAVLEELQTKRPDVTEISTDVNTSNEPMMAVNAALGFRPTTGEATLRKDLAV